MKRSWTALAFSLSAFRVFFFLPLKKKKPTLRTPPIETGHTKVCSRTGDKVAVGNVLGRNEQHLFRALPKLRRDHFSLYQLFPCGTFSNSIAWITGRHSLNLIALGSVFCWDPSSWTHISTLSSSAFFLPVFDLPSTPFLIPPPCTLQPLPLWSWQPGFSVCCRL